MKKQQKYATITMIKRKQKMTESQTVYEKAVTTGRPAERLAVKHGFESVAQLAESLAPGARVLDVGAGASPFGKEVAAMRPDITWVNFDYSYQDPAILEEVTKNAPETVQFTAGDATKLDEKYVAESFDAVFSYWLLPHLSLEDTAPAERAARAIFAVTKLGGLMSIGPKTTQKSTDIFRSGKAIQVTKDDTINADIFAHHIVRETKLSSGARTRQKLANEVATPFFGTTRYAKREGRIPKIYHPESGEYVSPLSKAGVKTSGRLAVAMVHHARQQHSNKKRF